MSRKAETPQWLMAALIVLIQFSSAFAQSRSSEWEKILDAGRKDARVVVSIPTSAELRKEFESGFNKAFPGIELELNVARGSSNINKIAEEQNAGVQSIDVHMGEQLRSSPDCWRRIFSNR